MISLNIYGGMFYCTVMFNFQNKSFNLDHLAKHNNVFFFSNHRNKHINYMGTNGRMT